MEKKGSIKGKKIKTKSSGFNVKGAFSLIKRLGLGVGNDNTMETVANIKFYFSK